MINTFTWQTQWPTAAEHLLTAGALLLVMMFVVAVPGRVKAQNFVSYPELDTRTIARGQLDKDYYNAKQNGATTVRDQSRKFAEPDGLRFGNFKAYPSLSATTTFDDNIFGSNNNPESDLRTEFRPSISIQSDLPRHALDFSLSGRIVTFLENSDQNYEDYRAVGSGALHFDHAHTLSAGFISELSHEEIGDITAPFDAAEPVPVFHNRASVGVTRDGGRLYGTLSAHAERWDYQDIRAKNGNRLDQDHRDTDAFSTRLQGGYRISPGYEFLASTSVTRYQHQGGNGFDLDGTKYDGLVGVGFETSPLLRFQLLGGYGVRDFDDASRESVNSSVFAGNVTWLPTRRMTLTAGVAREIADTIDSEGSTRVDTTATANVDYEIYHNLIGTAGVSFRSSDFDLSERTDDVWGLSLGLEYFYSKNMKFTAGYAFQRRESSIDSFDADRNRFTLGAKLQF
jgi:hypothetical protein